LGTHRRNIPLIIVVLMVVVLACSLTNQLDDKNADGLISQAVSTEIVASEGGEVLHPAGARLIIEPGALSNDTTVTITDKGYSQPSETGSTPLINLSYDFEIDLGGAYIVGESLLELTYAEETPFELRTNHILLSHMDGNGNRRLRGGAIDENTHTLSRNLGDLFETLSDKKDILQRVALTYIVPVTIPDQSAVSPPGSTPGIALVKLGSPPLVKQSNPQDLLQVPYYNQSGLRWRGRHGSGHKRQSELEGHGPAGYTNRPF